MGSNLNRWTRAEDALVLSYKPVPGRTRFAVNTRCTALGGTKPNDKGPPWTPAEDALALAYKPVPGRTLHACDHRRGRLGGSHPIAAPLSPAKAAMLRRFYGKARTADLAVSLDLRLDQVYRAAAKRGLRIGLAGHNRRPQLVIAMRDEGRDVFVALQRLVPEGPDHWDKIGRAHV